MADTKKIGVLERSVRLDRAAFNKEARTVTVRFSTETPVKRWFGTEILSHKSGAVKLDRFNAGAAVLMEHDTDKRCGITESATITATGEGEAVVRFARNPLGDACMAEVEDGTLRFVSVGYIVNRFEVDEDEEEYRAIDWEPLEVSFVGIPADPNAKILRSNHAEHTAEIMKRNTILHAAEAAGTGGGGGAAVVAPNIVTKEDFSSRMNEGQEILKLAAQYQARYPEVVEMAQKAIKDETGVRKFMADLMPVVSVQPKTEQSRIVQAAPFGARAGRMSVGEAFATSEAFKEAQKRGMGQGKHFAVEMPNLHSFQQRATFSIGDSDLTGSAEIGGTGGIGITVDPMINLLGKQAIAVASLFGQGQCNGDQIRIVRQQSLTNAAARVAEGGNKPESSADVIVVNFPVEKTAVFLNVTEEMLTDVAQAASFINEDLAYQVQAKEDSFLLNGTGSSQITGILNTSGIQTISGATNTVDKLKVAKAYVEGANGSGFAMPDAIVMNPLDWLSISLSKDSNGQYLFGGPGYAPYGVGGYSNMSQMWGLPVVTTTFLAQGTAIVGAFRQGATLYRRAGLTIRSTDSHASNFIANIVTVLAESRFALAVKQPNKFCTITGIPAAA